MAAPVNIQANLTLNPSSINASAKQVQQALGRITGQASEFQKSLDASTARVFAFGATTSVINGITQSFKKLVTTTVTVQAKLIEINSILGAGAGEFNKYRNSIFQVAKTTGQSFSTVAEGAAELARQGLNATESAKRLEAALILTRISGLGAEQSVKALTAAMNGFTSAGLTANQVVNKIVAVDTAFAVSAEDLAQGFSRAGSTAEDAGVKFEELLGLITAVEQRTARGGAVIGNAFKSIFTRLSRGDTIGQLQELGVAIDANQSGVQKLKALSDALENISDPTIASQIKELAGGVFQINVVSAALKDIGSQASVFGQATKTAFDATNEATEKNAALNTSLLAQINSLTVSVTSFAEKLGGITFGPLLENLVGIATKLSEGLDKALDPEKGSAFVQGLFKVIGSFISGPGLAVFTVAFAKIFKTVLKFARDGFKTVMEMGSATERIKQLEGGIVGLLQKDAALRQTLESTTASQAQKEKAVLDAIKRQNDLLKQQQQLVTATAAIARQGGVSGYSGSTGTFTGKKGKRFASGGAGIMEPDLMTAMVNEAKDAPKGAVPYLTMFRGQPAVMNSSEMQTRIGGREHILTQDQIPRFAKGAGKGAGRPKKPVYDERFGMIVPQKMSGVKTGKGKSLDGREYQFDIYGIDARREKAREEADLKKDVGDYAVKSAINEAKTMTGGDPNSSSIEKLNNQGSIGSLAGSIFETALSGLLKSPQFDFGETAAFDFIGPQAIKNIKDISPNFKGKLNFLEAKIGSNYKTNNSMANKMQRYIGKGGKISEAGTKELMAGSKQGFSATQAAVGAKLTKGGRRLASGTYNGKIPRYRFGSKFFAPGRTNTSKPRLGDRIKGVYSSTKETVKEQAGLGGGFGLAAVSAGLSSQAETFAKEGKTAAADLASAGSSIASFAGTGAMIAGPWGAAIGAVAGLGKSLYDATIGKTKEAEKVMEEAAKPTASGTLASISQDYFSKTGGLQGTQSRLKDLARRSGNQGLDISGELTAARDALKATEVGTKEFTQAQERYEATAARAARLLQNQGGILELAKRGEKLKAELSNLVSKNEGKALGRQLDERAMVQGAKSSLLGGLGGEDARFAGILRRENDVTGQVIQTGKAQANLEDLKSQLAGTSDPEEREKLKEAIAEASMAFKQSVVDSAVFFEQKQTEIANKLKEYAKQRAELTAQILSDKLSSITSAVKEGPISMESVQSFRKDFESARNDEERARAIADFETGVISKAQTPEQAGLLRSMAGLGTGSRDQLASDKDIARINKSVGYSGFTDKDVEALYGASKAGQGEDQRAKMDEMVTALKEQSERLRLKMDEFAEAFDAKKIVDQVQNMADSLRAGAKSLKGVRQASEGLGDATTAVHKLSSSAMKKIEEQQTRIDSLREEIREIKAQRNQLENL